jgi:heterodisulfide reductase subunit B
MSQYAYYPGCSITVNNRAYDTSTRAVCQSLGIDLVELKDWNCCGATAYMAVRELAAFVLSARNLALTEQQGQQEMLTVCNACYMNLNKTNRYMAEEPKLREQIGAALAAGGASYSGSVKVRHLLDVLVNEVGCEAIQARATRKLEGLKVACYYGCQLSRPYPTFDDAEQPSTMDRLLEAVGATAVPYPMKAKCCGGMVMSTSEEVALKLVKGLLQCALDSGADIIATACPLCQVNLEGYQGRVSARFGSKLNIPVVYFTQLVGLALGLTRQQVDLGRELVSADRALAAYV